VRDDDSLLGPSLDHHVRLAGVALQGVTEGCAEYVFEVWVLRVVFAEITRQMTQ